MAIADPYRLDRSVGRVFRRGEKPPEDGPVENGLAHMWPITLACWALANPELARKGPPPMRRDIVVLTRRAPKKPR